MRPIRTASGASGLLLAAWTVLGPGCVERLLQIRSDPPGAEVFVNGNRVGATPVTVPFTHYGTFDVVVRAQDRLSVHRLEPVHPPLYEWLPLDFIVENLVPFRIEDRREFLYELPPSGAMVQSDAAAERAAIQEKVRHMEVLAAKEGGE